MESLYSFDQAKIILSISDYEYKGQLSHIKRDKKLKYDSATRHKSPWLVSFFVFSSQSLDRNELKTKPQLPRAISIPHILGKVYIYSTGGDI